MDTVRYETDGPLAIVTIDRPKVRNCVDGPTATQLAAAFRRFDADPALAVAIDGRRGLLLRRRRPEGRLRESRQPGDTGWRRADGASGMLLGKPVIAAVEGCGGGGLSSRLRTCVAAEDAVFGAFCAAGACR
jgi:enoyl-CoA hydratase